jgi:hypothetical protein
MIERVGHAPHDHAFKIVDNTADLEPTTLLSQLGSMFARRGFMRFGYTFESGDEGVWNKV